MSDHEYTTTSNFGKWLNDRLPLLTLANHLTEETLTDVRNNIESKKQDLFTKCVIDINEFLRNEPFAMFLKSMYYHRYLQWLWLERRPVNEHNFYVYRLLGKGGFPF